jgi:hypothetical protein
MTEAIQKNRDAIQENKQMIAIHEEKLKRVEGKK